MPFFDVLVALSPFARAAMAPPLCLLPPISRPVLYGIWQIAVIPVDTLIMSHVQVDIPFGQDDASSFI